MKRFLFFALALVMALGLMAGCSAASAGERFDFEQSDGGFVPIFSDYPDESGVETFYELRNGCEEIPIPDAGKGLFISGNNHSDDLFMGYFKELEGFTPGASYDFTISFKLATDVEGGMMGIGGSPGESVFVKCGITSVKPENELDELNNFRLNIDKGNQGQGGEDMPIIGNITKESNERPDEYEFKELRAEVSASAGENGRVYLIIGTDSGFEGVSSYYLDDVEVSWSRAAQ